MLFRHARHIGHRVVPPLLLQQKRLIHHIERPFLPGRIAKPVVLWQAFDTGLYVRPRQAPPGILHLATGLFPGFLNQFHLFAGCRCQMGQPIRPSRRQSRGGNAHGHPRQCGMGRLVHHVIDAEILICVALRRERRLWHHRHAVTRHIRRHQSDFGRRLSRGIDFGCGRFDMAWHCILHSLKAGLPAACANLAVFYGAGH